MKDNEQNQEIEQLKNQIAALQDIVKYYQQSDIEKTEKLEHAGQFLQQAQAKLVQSEKMSSLGQMVAGVAHEINNPVNFIYGNLDHVNNYMEDLLKLVELYQEQYPNPTPAIQSEIEDIDLEFLTEDLPKTLSSMKIGTDRIRKIVLSLRNFSRLDEAEMREVDIHEGIDNTLLILNYKLKQGIEVIKKYGDLPLIECYPAQLNQVFMNIISNAIDALEEGLEKNQQSPVSHSQVETPKITIQTEVINYHKIQVQIQDNGPGITTEVKDKLFEPFFTTKPVGKGTGLGLSICCQIIEKHGGEIEVISPGKGTKFLITLPIKHLDY